MSVRTEKVASVIQEALAMQFQRYKPDFIDGLISIASVKVSPDISVAKVYVSLFRTKTPAELVVKKLNSRSHEIRKKLAPEISMKIVPELRFYLDDTVNALEHIDNLLKELKEANKF